MHGYGMKSYSGTVVKVQFHCYISHHRDQVNPLILSKDALTITTPEHQPHPPHSKKPMQRLLEKSPSFKTRLSHFFCCITQFAPIHHLHPPHPLTSPSQFPSSSHSPPSPTNPDTHDLTTPPTALQPPGPSTSPPPPPRLPTKQWMYHITKNPQPDLSADAKDLYTCPSPSSPLPQPSKNL